MSTHYYQPTLNGQQLGFLLDCMSFAMETRRSILPIEHDLGGTDWDETRTAFEVSLVNLGDKGFEELRKQFLDLGRQMEEDKTDDAEG